MSGGIIPEPLYNSELETGTRTVVILDAAYPRTLDLARLTWFDHLVVHTEDIGGPKSLHPALSSRTGEMLVRRRLVETSLALMRRLHLVDIVHEDQGVAFRAGDDAPAFVGLLRTKYATALKERAKWLVAELGDTEEAELTRQMATRIDHWAVAFQGEADPQDQRPT